METKIENIRPEVGKKQNQLPTKMSTRFFGPLAFWNKPKPQPTKTPEQQLQEQLEEQKKKDQFAHARVKELWELFKYIESRVGNRKEQRQFRRDFVSDGTIMGDKIQLIVDYYERNNEMIQKRIEEIKNGTYRIPTPKTK